MTPESIDEVWQMLDREQLASLAHSGPEVVFATISGAHLYGFCSPDSDVDLRGAYILPAADILGLGKPEETITVDGSRDGIELDWVAHDLRKFVRMMVQHNGYVLEQLYSPLVVVSTDEHKELLELGKGCITRPTVRHYKGFARGRRQRLAQPGATIKHLLYAYRVYLSGIHLMRSGEIDANILSLNQRFNLSQISDLVQRKREGAELLPLQAGEAEQHEPELDRLEAELDQAHEKSTLPDEPTTRDALDAFVIRARLKRAAS